eukprot:560638-Rhodomonas_salina.1
MPNVNGPLGLAAYKVAADNNYPDHTGLAALCDDCLINLDRQHSLKEGVRESCLIQPLREGAVIKIEHNA